jgi:hypothetical protein
MLKNIIRILSWAIFTILTLLSLTGCFLDDDGGSESRAWVRIDSPVDGFSTGDVSVTVEGNAALGEASYAPEAIYWYNNGASGVLPHQTICLLACLAVFQGDVPLFIGDNAITVQLDNGSDTVNVTRYPQVVVQGRVVMDATGYGIPGVTITLSGDRDSTTVTDDAGYLFSDLRDGSYSIQANLIPPQSTDCLNITPDKHDFEVITEIDILDLDFTASQLMPCYFISGQVTASPNPDVYIPEFKMTLTDANNNAYVVYSTAARNYVFWHIAPGTYTLTPSDDFGGSFIPETSTVTITDSYVSAVDFIRVSN